MNSSTKHLEIVVPLDTMRPTFVLFNQGEVLKARGDLAGSRKKHEDAPKIRTDLGEAETIPASDLALAELALDEGRFAEAIHLAGISKGENAPRDLAARCNKQGVWIDCREGSGCLEVILPV